jgi:hypothetical protein
VNGGCELDIQPFGEPMVVSYRDVCTAVVDSESGEGIKNARVTFDLDGGYGCYYNGVVFSGNKGETCITVEQGYTICDMTVVKEGYITQCLDSKSDKVRLEPGGGINFRIKDTKPSYAQVWVNLSGQTECNRIVYCDGAKIDTSIVHYIKPGVISIWWEWRESNDSYYSEIYTVAVDKAQIVNFEITY